MHLRSKLRKQMVCCTWSVLSWGCFGRAGVFILGSCSATPAQCAFDKDLPGHCEKDLVQLGAFDLCVSCNSLRLASNSWLFQPRLYTTARQTCTTTPGFTQNYLRSLFFATILKIAEPYNGRQAFCRYPALWPEYDGSYYESYLEHSGPTKATQQYPKNRSGIVAHACHLSTGMVEEGGSISSRPA